MSTDFNTFVFRNNGRTLEISKLLIKAAQETRTMISRSAKKSERACEAMKMADKEVMWGVLQEYIAQYSTFVSQMKCFTGIGIVLVDRETYEQITVDDIRDQLQISIGVVYAHEAFLSIRKETYKQCLKKLLKNSGLFSDSELKLLDI